MLDKAAALSTNEGLARDGAESHWQNDEACAQHRQVRHLNIQHLPWQQQLAGR